MNGVAQTSATVFFISYNLTGLSLTDDIQFYIQQGNNNTVTKHELNKVFVVMTVQPAGMEW